MQGACGAAIGAGTFVAAELPAERRPARDEAAPLPPDAPPLDRAAPTIERYDSSTSSPASERVNFWPRGQRFGAHPTLVVGIDADHPVATEADQLQAVAPEAGADQLVQCQRGPLHRHPAPVLEAADLAEVKAA